MKWIHDFGANIMFALFAVLSLAVAGGALRELFVPLLCAAGGLLAFGLLFGWKR